MAVQYRLGSVIMTTSYQSGWEPGSVSVHETDASAGPMQNWMLEDSGWKTEEAVSNGSKGQQPW